MFERSSNGTKLSESKTESRIITDTNQFMHIADKLIGALAFEERQLKETGVFGNQKVVEKYNIVSGRLSSQDQDVSKFRLQSNQANKDLKTVTSIHKSTDLLSLSHIQREKQRDKELQHKLQQLNLKSAARIREIREVEERQKDAELKKLITGAKREYKEDLQQHFNHQPTVLPIESQERHSRNESFSKQNSQLKQTVQKMIIDSEPQKFESNEKQYFNIPPIDTKSSSELPSVHYEKVNRSQNHSLYQKTIPYQPNELTNSTMVHSASQKTINQMNTSSVNWGTKINRTREDVSFLKENSLAGIKHISKVPLPFDKSTQGLLLSTSHITSGDSARDEYFQVVLGLRSIGRSIIDMPRNIEDLKRLSKQYNININAVDQIQDENIYLSYIEDHYLAQCKKDADPGDQEEKQNNSPIRDLQEFYQKMFNKLNINDGNLSQRGRPVKHSTSSLINIKEMTASELMNLEKSPPIINTNRKKLMLIDNKIMNQYGEEAFKVNLNQNNNTRQQKSPINQSPKKIEKVNLSKELQTNQVSNKEGSDYASKVRDASKIKLLKSLSDHGDLLVKPSIKVEEDSNKNQYPSWMQTNKSSDFPQLNLGKDLGKPSARQDAILLAKWFHDIMEVIEQESINSVAKRQRMQDQNKGRLFASQNAFENEISQFNTFHFVQIAHNIAIKEITRQISVQCIERGVLLKSIFDSYIRLIDLIYIESFNVRRNLTKNFASIFEKQIKLHETAIERENQIINQKQNEVAQLKQQLMQAERREQGLKTTNKKVTKLAVKNQALYEQEQKQSAAYERQVKYLEDKVGKLQDNLDPSRYDQMQKELRRALNKIQKDTVQNYQPIKGQVIPGTQEVQGQTRLDDNFELKNEDIIREADHSTCIDGFEQHLENVNGYPKHTDQLIEAIAETSEKELSAFDLKEVGLLQDNSTTIDDNWRRKTRIKRSRAKSVKPKAVIGVLEESSANENFSDNTSTRTQLQYKEAQFSATWNAHIPMKSKIMPVLKKRSISAGNLNENIIIEKKMNKLQRLKQAKLEQKINKDPLLKLKKTMGDALIKDIMENEMNLYKQLLDVALKQKKITLNICKEVLQDYKETISANITVKYGGKRSVQDKKMNIKTNRTYDSKLNENENKIQNNPQNYHGKKNSDKKKFQNTEFKGGPFQMNTISEGTKTPQSDDIMICGKFDETPNNKGQRSVVAKKTAIATKETSLSKKRSIEKVKEKVVREPKFQEWNFQKRQKAEVAQKVREHPSYAYTQKVLKKKEKITPNDLMPIKTLARYINVIYVQFDADMRGISSKKHHDQNHQRTGSISLDVAAINPQISLKKQQIRKDYSPNEEEQRSQLGIKPLGNRAQSQLEVPATKNVQFQTQFGQSHQSVSNEMQGPEAKSFEPTLIEWVYDYMQQRYGLKNVAEKKFSALVLSCIKYKDRSPRIKMFGRFLQLYDNYERQDLKLYLDIQETLLKLVLNYQIQEGDEETLVPLYRALDYFKMIFMQRLTAASLSHCLNQLKNKATQLDKEEQKVLHLKNSKEAISLDLLSEQIITTTNSLQAEKIKNIEDLFHAADLDANGVINSEEFKTLYKLIVTKITDSAESQFAEIKKVFDEYAEFHENEDEGTKPQRGIDHASFQRLCIEKEIFTIRAQNQFINMQQKTYLNVTEPQDAFQNAFNNLKENLDQTYERLQKAVKEMSNRVLERDKKRYLEMIDQMIKCIMYPVNQKIAFLTQKIVVETIRRAVIKDQIEMYMPVNISSIKSFKQTLIDGGTIRSQKTSSVLSKLGANLVSNPMFNKIKTFDSHQGSQSPRTDIEEATKQEKFKLVIQNLQQIGNFPKKKNLEYQTVDETSKPVNLIETYNNDTKTSPQLKEQVGFDSFRHESHDSQFNIYLKEQLEASIPEMDQSRDSNQK